MSSWERAMRYSTPAQQMQENVDSGKPVEGSANLTST